MLSCGASVTGFVQVWFAADTFLKGVALLALCLILYLYWLHFHEKLQRRRDERDRRRQRRSHWGYE